MNEVLFSSNTDDWANHKTYLMHWMQNFISH